MEEKNMDIFYELQTKPPPGKLKQHSIVDKERKKPHASLDFVICQYILSCVICFFPQSSFNCRLSFFCHLIVFVLCPVCHVFVIVW